MRKCIAWILTIAVLISVMPVSAMEISADITNDSATEQENVEQSEYGITTLSAGEAVARIETDGQWKYYDTMKEAFDAVGQYNDATIELLRDVKESELYTDGTKNFSVGVQKADAPQQFYEVGTIVITGGEDGKRIVGEELNTSSHFMNNYAENLTLKNLTFTGLDRGGFIWNMKNGAVITLENVSIEENTFSDKAFGNNVNNSMTLNLTNGSKIQNNITKNLSNLSLKDNSVTVNQGEGCIFSENTFPKIAQIKSSGEQYNTLADAIGHADAGDTILILRDAVDKELNPDQNGSCGLTKSITVDYQNHVIVGENTSTTNWGHLFNVNSGTGNLTLKNVTFKNLCRGGITWNSVSNVSITLENVTFSNCTFEFDLFGSVASNVTLRNTKIVNSTNTDTAKSVAVEGTSVTLDGATTIKGNNFYLKMNAADKLKIAAGFSGTVEISGLTNGGQFATLLDEDYDVTKAVFINSADPTRGVSKSGTSLNWRDPSTAVVAKIGTSTYKTFQEAIDAAGTDNVGTTIELLRDMTDVALIGEGTNIIINKSVTIDGQDHMITDGTPGGRDHIFLVQGGAYTVTIKNVSFEGLKRNGLIYINTADGNSAENSIINLENVKIQNFACPEEGKMIGNVDSCSITVNLKNTVIKGNQGTAGILFNDTIPVTVSGNTVITENAKNIIVENADNLIISDDYTGKISIEGLTTKEKKFAKIAGDVTEVSGEFVNEEHQAYETEIVNENGTKYLRWAKDEVAQIVSGATVYGTYTSLAEAIIAYDNDESKIIKLISDTKETPITLSKTIYLDLNGFTVTADITGSSTNKLCCFDSTTNGYRTTGNGAGKIVGTVKGAEKVVTIAPEKTGKTSSMYYISIQGEEGLEFHRYYIGFRKVKFKLDADNNESTLEYTCYVQGDGAVLNALSGLGFTAYETDGTPKGYVYLGDFSSVITQEHECGTGKENGTGTIPVFYTAKIFDGNAGDTADAGRYEKNYNVQAALITKDGIVAASKIENKSFMDVVNATYANKSETEKKEIDQFLEAHGLATIGGEN